MSKPCKSVSKTCCERYKTHIRAYSNSDRTRNCLKKTVPSNGEKSCSTGKINDCKRAGTTIPKKTTKSDLNFSQRLVSNIDYCKKCGDVASQNDNRVSDTRSKLLTNISNRKQNSTRDQLQQFYKNEHFKQSSHSFKAENLRRISLKTILEQPEKSENIFEIHPDSDREIGFMDPDDVENIKNIKEFRNKNYFECHSAKSRINSKYSVTSLNNHKCVYRFYLNERLFPVPLNTDYQGNIRCIECHLPLDKNSTEVKGTVQAKIKFNNEVQDTLLVLPVSKALIVKEKRKEFKTEEDDIYFGIIKLDLNGNSVFNRTLPEDSLALRYQKGYREFSRTSKYEYDSFNDYDKIII